MAQAQRFTFLIDSNVMMTLEPHIAVAPSEPYDLASRFVRLVHRHGHRIAVHAATRDDVLRDHDPRRRAHRLQVLQKYEVLEAIPVSERFAEAFPVGSENDRVDFAMASALDAHAAHFLVTEDKALRRRVLRIAPEIGSKVVALADAVEFLDALHPEPKAPPPLVERRFCYQLSLSDPIFDTLRAEYDGFDRWFEKCQLEQREAFVILGEDGNLAGICVLKDEDDDDYALPRCRTKLCTLKVAEPYRGERLGELLVKAALDDAIERLRSSIYVTVFAQHEELIGLLNDLGFVGWEQRTTLDEQILVRGLAPPSGRESQYEPFELNRLFGPRVLDLAAPMHVVPIQPRWEDRLFPEGRIQLKLLDSYPACGNGLRKAYLSRAASRQVQRGDILLFYRSEDEQAVRFVCVVESTLVSNDWADIAQFVGTRTVYSEEEIRDIAGMATSSVLALLMRQSRFIEPGWAIKQLVSNHVVSRAPQSIQAVSREGAELVRKQLAA